MPVKNRDAAQYKREYEQQKARGEKPARKKRYEARAALDKAGVDRAGKHVAHTVALSNGGSNARSNIKIVEPHANLSFARKANHKPKR